MLGRAFYLASHRDRRKGGGLIGNEVILALDFYRGYSPNGQFLDQRLRYRPMWYVMPSITAHF